MRYFNPYRKILSFFLAFLAFPSFPVLLVALASLVASCKERTPVNIRAKVPIPGTWKIVKVVRNLDNITAGSDFSRPVITLDADGTYTVDKTNLFMVDKNGHWSAGTRSGSYIIFLKPMEGDSTTAYEMRYDTTGAREKLIVNFTTAGSNTYQYLLEKVNP